MNWVQRQRKGTKLQKLVANIILRWNPSLEYQDVQSTPMGANDADIRLSDKAKKLFPYKVECKNQQRMKELWVKFAQAEDHTGAEQPLLVVKRERCPPLAVVHLEEFIKLVHQSLRNKK